MGTSRNKLDNVDLHHLIEWFDKPQALSRLVFCVLCFAIVQLNCTIKAEEMESRTRTKDGQHRWVWCISYGGLLQCGIISVSRDYSCGHNHSILEITITERNGNIATTSNTNFKYSNEFICKDCHAKKPSVHGSLVSHYNARRIDWTLSSKIRTQFGFDGMNLGIVLVSSFSRIKKRPAC